MESTTFSMLLSSLGTIVAIVGIGWFGLDRMEQRIKADAQKAHDQIRQNIDTLRSEVSGMRSEITDLTGRVGRIEGLLEVMRDGTQSAVQ